MKTKKKFTHRLLSVLLCFTLLASYLTLFSFTVGAANEVEGSYYNRIADESTIDGWKKYFDLRDGYLDTSNAGGVWTDKSVFTDASLFSNAGVTMIDDSKNFLTVLSAIAANKEVVGYSTVPTDTVLVLDVSGSMEGNEQALVSAANAAIARLLEVNNNNRVGVVLYSAHYSASSSTYGESVTRLLPIGRYTATNNEFLYLQNETVSGTNRRAYHVNISSSIKLEGSNTSVDTSVDKAVEGGTYIQAGLWEAMKMFLEMDTTISQNNWQSGDQRMPIMVLMSDGAPTQGTTMYNDVENSYYTTGRGRNQQNVSGSNVGNGKSANLRAGNAFLTQLTASYVMNRIENYYQAEDGTKKGLFYTLGFNIEGDALAESVMDPKNSTVTDSLWNSYTSSTSNSLSLTVKGRSGDDQSVSIYKDSYVTGKNYVDEYFSASDGGLTDAFNEIVEEILIQSRYYPTHLQGGSPDFSGYFEFTDQIGDYMEVKHINGILLGDTLFDGHMMASKLADTSDGGLGTPENPTDLGNEFVWAVQSRLGITDVATARALVANAYNAEQICYITDGSGNVTKWSNYIGWYADASGNYLGHWNEQPGQTVPENAVYKVKSFGFLGETSGSIKNSDMMYMSVQVKQNIATGQQTVTWKIPASLVPMITYNVEVNGISIDTATEATLSVEDKNVSPIRLVYETGLRSDLNEFNITRITSEEHIAEDGHTRIFWNNYFDLSGSSEDHDKHITTMSEFMPNKDNERFYFTFDSAVYKETSAGKYELVTEEEGIDPDNNTYYHRRFIFKDDPDNSIVFFYEKMSKESALAALENGFISDFENLEHQTVGAWVVPKGTPARELEMYNLEKTSNPTNSALMVFHPYMTTQNNLVAVDMNLGNNGLLSVVPATGIKISKTVDIFEDGTSDLFKFRLSISENGTYDTWITSLDATPAGNGTPVTIANGVYEFEMSKDQTFWISGLPAGTTYTIEEISENDDYKVKSVHVNGISTGKVASGSITQYLIDDVDFVNTAVGEGDLVITKQVVDASGNTVDVNDNIKFTIQVALTDASGDPVSGTFESTNGNFTVPSNGIFTIELSDGKSFILRGIPEKTNYTVTETNIPNGFAFSAENSSVSGVVDSTANDQALIVNTYAPTQADGQDVDIIVTKTISGNRTEWLDGESYTFTLERLNLTRSSGTVIATDTISSSDTEKKITFDLADEDYTVAGTYYYRITETAGSQGGITYDTAVRTFSVVVGDSDMDGDLEVTSVNNTANTTVSGTWTVSTNFNNIYAPTGSTTATVNIEKSINDGYSLAGFQFALYSDAELENEIKKSNVTGTDGLASISLTFSTDGVTMDGTTYTYYLAEIEGSNKNITYSDKVYTVKVTVKDNGNGQITAETAIEGVEGDTVSFENVYTPSASDYLTLAGSKVITTQNRVLNAGEFSFVLSAVDNAPLPDVTTVKNTANGSFTFDSIEFKTAGTYKYVISEVSDDPIGGFTYDKKNYYITVNVVDNGDVTLTASITSILRGETEATATAAENIVFENEYYATPTTLSFSGTKNLTGKVMIGEDFEFEIKAVTDGAPMPEKSTVKNKKDGTFGFGEITFSKAGKFTYTITEVDGKDARYKYDNSVYTITVTVTDNSEGTLSATYEMHKNNMTSTEIVFSNLFTPQQLTYDIYAKFGGTKQLEGRDLTDGEFEFKLINAVNGKQIGDTVRNDAQGIFKFPEITISAAGTYHYKITEVIGDEKCITYDTNQYHVVLRVTQDSDGNLSYTDELHIGKVLIKDVEGVPTESTEYEDITEDGAIVFNNIYKSDPAYVTLNATKILTGRSLNEGEFTFILKEKDATEEIARVTNNKDGEIVFYDISFPEAGTYTYVIYEELGTLENVDYDETEYVVEITVTDDGKGNLVPSTPVIKKSGSDDTVEEIIFENIYTVPYDPDNPPTGDNTNLGLWLTLLLVSCAGVTGTILFGKKRKIEEN